MSAGATDVDAEVVEAIDATAEADAVESPPAGTEAEVDEVAEVVEVAEVEEPAIETEVVGQTEVVEVDEVTEANETVSAATGTVGEVAELDAPESEEPAIETEMPTDTVDEVEIVEIEEAAEAEVGVPAVEAETAIATEMPIETVSEMEVVEIDETVPAATDTVGEMQAVEIEEVDEPQVEEPVTETEVVNEAEVVDLDDVAAAGDQATAIETVSEVEVVEAVEAAEVEEPVTGTGAVGEPVAATRPMARTVGYLPTRPQPNSTFFFASADLYRQPLPKAVDLRPLLAPIIHQGAVAVADAVAAAVDALAGTVGLSGAASRRFIDFNTRLRMGTTNPTVPLSIQAALEAVVRFGASSEAICPWEPDRLGERPAAEAYTAPVPLAFSGLQQVPLNLNAWRQALAEGKVIVFGMAFVEDPDACTTLGGVVPMVTVDAAQTASVQAVQAFACVGYNDTEKVFIIRNCWGEAWGDGGYAYLPYNMVMCKKFVDSDCWVLVPAQPPPLPKARWSDGSTLVTDGGNGIGVETNPIDAAAYWAVSRNFVRDSMVAYIPATPDFARV
ncbi:MAG: C1 family peptidase [Ancalomicrobiaceae bacterium]|nr:C1 family peptidase [Ancalomicrobiaceae bacterium]